MSKKSVLHLSATLLLAFFVNQTLAQVKVVELTAQQLAEEYAKGSLTAVEVTQAYLDRIRDFELNYNAFTFLNENALATAAALDEERMSSGTRGPLHGVPVVIKDQIDVAGMPTTMGLAELSSLAGGVDLIPAHDSAVVRRLKQAGAIVIGKTNMPGFGFDGTRTTETFIPSWDGATHNAYDRSLAPGASSAGTGTAVSASFGTLGLGTEFGGSIQNPAGAQGLVGIKPSYGLVPNHGVFAGGGLRGVVGPMALSVFDAALAMDIIAGQTEDDPATVASLGQIPEGGYTSLLSLNALQGTRIGLYGSGWNPVSPSPETQLLYDHAMEAIEAEGATLVEDPFLGTDFNRLAMNPFGTGDVRGIESIVFNSEQYLGRLFDTENGLEHLDAITDVNLFNEGGKLRFLVDSFEAVMESLIDPDLAPNQSEFLEVRDAYRDVFNSVMEANELDALVFPQMLRRTPPLSGNQAIEAPTADVINIMGTPGVTVPAGYYENGSPFSLIFIGDLYSEPELLAYAYDYEQATDHRVAPELIHVADANRDGKVDFADFLVVSGNFGKRRTGTHRGDLNADRTVDFADFLILSNAFGYDASEAVSVPEPATGSIVGLLVAFLHCLKQRRRRPDLL